MATSEEYQNELDRISANVSETLSAVSDMGGTVPEGASSDDMAAAVYSIPQGTNTEQVQPDWNENDPESMAYIQNRPGGYVGYGDTFTWDGNITDGITLTDWGDGFYGYKVSDKVVTSEDINGDIEVTIRVKMLSTGELLSSEGHVVCTRDEMILDSLEDGFWSILVQVPMEEIGLINQMVMCIPTDNFEADGLVFPEKGIYCSYMADVDENDAIIYPARVTITNFEAFPAIIPIDEQYLPDSVKAVPTVTTSDNGKFLRVVDGAWAAVTVANAEEVSF